MCFAKLANPFLRASRFSGLEILFIDTAVHLERPYSSYDDYGIRFDTGKAAFDIHEFFSTQVSTETGFRNGNITHLQGQFRRHDGVAAVRDIGKRTTVDQ